MPVENCQTYLTVPVRIGKVAPDFGTILFGSWFWSEFLLQIVILTENFQKIRNFQNSGQGLSLKHTQNIFVIRQLFFVRIHFKI